MRCQEIMTKNPVTVTMESTVLEVARVMAEKDIGFVPICDKSGVAVGTVTDRDIVVRCVAKERDPKNARLKEFGGNQVVCVQPEDDVSKARNLMEQHKVQRILVCDASKHPRGVISLQDLSQSSQDVGETVRSVKSESSTHPTH